MGNGRAQLFDVLEGRQLLTVNPPAAAGPWTAAYVDEFNSLNTSVWTNGRTWGNSDVTASGTFSPNNATVSNGALTLLGQNQSSVGTNKQTYPLTSGMIQSGGIQGVTASGFEFQYGYVDVRVKANSGNGFWTAAYLLPESHQDGYEVDLLENKGIQPYTYYGGFHDWRNGAWGWGSTPLSFNDTQAYHDYAVDWEPGSLTFYVDGQAVRNYTGSDVPSQPMYLIINLDAGPYAGDVTQALPNDPMSVDSVAFWQHTPDYFLAGQGVGALANPPANQFGNSSFEQENVNVSAGATYAYHPSDAYWSFNDHSGIAANGSGFNNANAPDGAEVAFLQGLTGSTAGRISQSLNITTDGSYNVSFQAAERSNQVQPIAVSVDSTVIATITPSSSSFATYTTPNFNLTAGSHKITFSATDTGSDKTSFIDKVAMNYVSPVVNPTPPILTTTAVSSSSINLSWTPGNTTATSYSIEIATDGVNYESIGTAAAGATSYQVTGLNPSTKYDFEVVAENGTANSPASNAAEATTLATSIPSAWTSADIGSPSLSGSSSFANGVYTVTGAGNDIWNATDQFQFVSQPSQGDTAVIARVTSQINTNPWAKAGVMIRASSAANAAWVDVVQTPSNGVDLQWRDASGNLGWTAGPTISTNASIKLIQTGNAFTGYASTDGANWTKIGSVTIAMPSSTLSGLVVTSHNAALAGTATFDNVSVTSLASSAPTPPTGLTVSSVTDTTASLAWTPGNGTAVATGYTIADSTDGIHFNTVGTVPAGTTSYQVTGLLVSTNYSFEVTANYSSKTSSPSNVAQVSTASPTIAAPWSSTDIGSPGVAGSASNASGVYTVSGSGGDIWYSSDQFQFVNQAANGNTTVIARVTSQTDTHVWAKAGVMIRASSAPNSAFVDVVQTPASGVALQWRDASGTNLNWAGGTSVAYPVWLELNRAGNTFTGSYSTDGTNWTTIGTTTIAMPSATLAGLAVSSLDNTRLGTATFDNVSVSSLAAPSAPAGLIASAVSSTSVNLTWTIGSGGGAASGFPIQVSADGTNFNTFATAPAGATSYQVTGLVPSTAYTFRVSAANATGTSAPSNSAAAATPATSSGTFPTGWSSADVGSPAITGTSSYNAGTYTLSSDGIDIWGTSDQFRFVSSQAVGDATLLARVISQTNTGATAKAGVMFRASNAANSSFVDLVQTPGGGVRLQWRDGISGGTTQMVVGGTYSNPVWLEISRSGNNFTGYASTDGVKYTKIGTVTVALPVETLAGLAVSSFSANSASTAVFDNVNLKSKNPWMSSDIGAPAIAGSATFSADLGSITLTGSGTGIRGTADQFQFADRMTSGNTTVSAQVTSQTGTNGWAKSGVMIRPSSDPSSAYVAVMQTVGNGLSFEWRTASGATEKYLGNLPVVSGAVDLKLARVGNTFTAYYSTDGATYSQLGSVTIAMGTNTFSGVATTSHDATTSNTAVFTQVKVTNP